MPLEEHGEALTTEDVARGWLRWLPAGMTFTAERAAYRTLLQKMNDGFVFGAPPGFDLAECADNPFSDCGSFSEAVERARAEVPPDSGASKAGNYTEIVSLSSPGTLVKLIVEHDGTGLQGYTSFTLPPDSTKDNIDVLVRMQPETVEFVATSEKEAIQKLVHSNHWKLGTEATAGGNIGLVEVEAKVAAEAGGESGSESGSFAKEGESWKYTLKFPGESLTVRAKMK